MPNLRSMSVDGNAITLVGSDGRSITLTKAQIQAHAQSESGSAATRKANTITWIKQQIEAALGAENVPVISIGNIDFDLASGTPSVVEVN